MPLRPIYLFGPVEGPRWQRAVDFVQDRRLEYRPRVLGVDVLLSSDVEVAGDLGGLREEAAQCTYSFR